MNAGQAVYGAFMGSALQGFDFWNHAILHTLLKVAKSPSDQGNGLNVRICYISMKHSLTYCPSLFCMRHSEWSNTRQFEILLTAAVGVHTLSTKRIPVTT